MTRFLKSRGWIILMFVYGSFFSGCSLGELVQLAVKAGTEAAEKKLEEEKQEKLGILAEQLSRTPKGEFADALTGEMKPIFWTLEEFDTDPKDGEYNAREVSKIMLAIQADRLKKLADAKLSGDKEAEDGAVKDIKSAGKAAGMLGIVLLGLKGIQNHRKKKKKRTPPGDPDPVAAVPRVKPVPPNA